MWINESDLKVFRLHSDIRSYFKNVSFPATLSDDNISEIGLKPIKQIAKPSYDYLTQSIEESSPTKINGEWTQVWKIVPATSEEIDKRKKEVKSNLMQETQNRLDAFAQSKGYDNILSATTYATSAVAEYQKDGQCAVEARDSTWNKLFQIFSDVDAGKRPMPINYSQIESELPPLSWK